MAFRLQDLMIDVWPGQGFQLANERCTCVISAGAPGAEREPETPAEEPGGKPGRGPGIPRDNPACVDTILPSGDCPPDAVKTLAADLVALKAQLRRDLGSSL
jgi:hypothetical protein